MVCVRGTTGGESAKLIFASQFDVKVHIHEVDRSGIFCEIIID